MSSPVAFADLMTAVRGWTNTENRTGFLTDADIRRGLNEGLQEFHERLVAARGQEHIRAAWPITVVPNQSAYSLPADFFELISIDIQVGPNQFINCRAYMESERNAFRLYPGWSGWYMGLPVYFRLLGSMKYANTPSPLENSINFIPNSNTSFPITLNYIYAFPVFDPLGSQDTNKINSVNGWTQFAVWHAVALGKGKLKEDPTFALSQKAAVLARILEMAPQNSAGDAERIRDVEGNDFETLGWWR